MVFQNKEIKLNFKTELLTKEKNVRQSELIKHYREEVRGEDGRQTVRKERIHSLL